MNATTHDDLVPDEQVRREFGNISTMTLWRWDNDPALGFPPPVMIRKRKFRSRRLLEEFKQRMVETAIAARSRVVVSPGKAA